MAQTRALNYTGGVQRHTMTYEATVTAYLWGGGGGGGSGVAGFPGGAGCGGGYASVNFTVSPGDTIEVAIGGGGGGALNKTGGQGGFGYLTNDYLGSYGGGNGGTGQAGGGGGGSGGATVLLLNGSPIAVAGGGAGGGGGQNGSAGNPGIPQEIPNDGGPNPTVGTSGYSGNGYFTVTGTQDDNPYITGGARWYYVLINGVITWSSQSPPPTTSYSPGLFRGRIFTPGENYPGTGDWVNCWDVFNGSPGGPGQSAPNTGRGQSGTSTSGQGGQNASAGQSGSGAGGGGWNGGNAGAAAAGAQAGTYGSSYYIGSGTVANPTNRNPPNTSIPQYLGSAGLGGSGSTAQAINGNNGLAVLEFESDGIFVHDAGTFQPVQEIFVKYQDQWRQPTLGWIKSGGIWEPLVGLSAPQFTAGIAGSYRFTTPGTYNPQMPAVGVTQVFVTVVGGGGGGGSAWFCGDAWTGGGGGSGGYINAQLLTINPAETLSVTVGAGGAGGYYPGWCQGQNNGSAGGNSTLIGFYGSYTATGGSGGAAGIFGTGFGYGGTPNGVNGQSQNQPCFAQPQGGNNGSGYGRGGQSYCADSGTAGQNGFVGIFWGNFGEGNRPFGS